MGGCEVQKKHSRKGKLNEKKIHARQLTLKDIHAKPKKNSYKEFDNEKKFLRLENSPPPPPHKFSNGPSLTGDGCLREPCFEKRSGLIIFTELIAPYQGKYGFRNPGNFCLWNPKCGKIFLWNQESWALESGTWL